MKTLSVLLVLVLGSCALPPPGQPAHPARAGRFIGLVANCGCGTGLNQTQVMAGYPQVVAGRYSERDIASMRGWVELGAEEQYQNQLEICAQVCAQSCAVNAVAEPLGGRTIPGVPACTLTERDLHLTIGRTGDSVWP